MEITQHQIKRSLSSPEALSFIGSLLEEDDSLTRTDVARSVCEQFGFRDPSGDLQLSTCLKALRDLDAAGLLELPEVNYEKGVPSPIRLTEPVPEPKGVPATVGLVQGLELVLVTDDGLRRIWNELMIREHARGAAIFAGRQLRYLVSSDHGYLGALGFAAPALKLADRDRWIGWDEEQRRAHLDKAICLTRFLIRPSVHCQNLATRVLSMGMERLVVDFEQRYNYRPLLVETFVDSTQFSGTSFRAANWTLVGQTQGRGRQDQFNQYAKTIKDIYVYPLEKDFRARLGLAAGAGLGPRSVAQGVFQEAWAQQEMGGASLGDQRRSQRLVEIAAAKAKRPGDPLSKVFNGDKAGLKGAYRLIDSPDEDAVSMEKILAPHRERTIQRMQGQRVVLCIQDGSDLTFTSLPQCEGLGVIGKNQTGAQGRGLHLHTTLAVTGSGLPLGVLRTECTAPELKSEEDKRPASSIPIEEKKTFSWVAGMRDTASVAAQMPNTQVINVCDREADIFELFDEQRRNPFVDLIVRAHHNRVLNDRRDKLFEALRGSPVQANIQIQIPRQSERPKLSGSKARRKRLGRKAELEIRFLQVELPCPNGPEAPLTVWAIHALEKKPPKGEEPTEWFIYSTTRIESPQDAIQCLRWYATRWRIEDFHRTLKSGCGAETLTHHSADRLRRVIAINMVIAWRIMLMTLLGREYPNLDPEVAFSNVQLTVLGDYAKKGLTPPSTVKEAVRLLAIVGGYHGNDKSPPPGHQILWDGYSILSHLIEGYDLGYSAGLAAGARMADSAAGDAAA